MRMSDIIQKKRDGLPLSDREIKFFIDGYTSGEIPDYQASALCMAIYFRGMSDAETVTLTKCMANSGDTLDLSRFGDLTSDKHSTGGVGDKTTLVVAPIVASLGGYVTKMSGRGLGHTGGTADKLESIPGYRLSLSEDEFIKTAEKTGIAVISQTGNLTPADKKLYALRDVTATIESIPLLTSSIMSKKLAAGAKNIVLDVKYGSGAFMKTAEDAGILAETMVKIGKSCGRNVTAVLTNMDIPLGSNIGNALEVKEAVRVIQGKQNDELSEVCFTLAAEMVSQVRKIPSEEARTLVTDSVSNGSAFEKMKEWIAAQGGDANCLSNTDLLPSAPLKHPVISDKTNYITGTDAQLIGHAAMILGAGRASKEDVIDPSAGIVMNKKPGDFVKEGDIICTLHTSSPENIPAAEAEIRKAVIFGDKPPEPRPLIYKIIK
ncbi:MAG: thymidine phosphorylase [Oscillospiraceae bacterium]|nr:thymidine phosphorylase [Oscillospiraceae bacterium]